MVVDLAETIGVRWRCGTDHRCRIQESVLIVTRSAGASSSSRPKSTQGNRQAARPGCAVLGRSVSRIRTADTNPEIKVRAATTLTALAAPSASVCWVVGRTGVVLLSTDGKTWRRLPFPETADLMAIQATDARSASVSTADARTFDTTDGGVTWVLRRPLQEF